jgi:long-chain acyl-CoA synthetase
MLIASALHRAASCAPTKPALIVGGRAMDYRELDRQARDIAVRLIAAGVAPGDRVALHMHNSFELAVAYFACFYAGAVAVPVNTRMKAAEIAYVLDHSGASLYLGQPDLFAEIAELPACFPDVRQWVTDLCEIDVPARRLAAAELPIVDADQPAAIVYTSGSTARPKGVVHTHESLWNVGRGLSVARYDIVMLITPMVHAAALAGLLASLEATATVATLAQFDPDAVLDAVARHHGTFLFGMPVMFRALIAAQNARPRNVRSLTRCFAGGDAVPPALKTEFAKCFGAPLRELFGTTESGLIAVNWSDMPSQANAFGRPCPGIDILLIGENGEPAPIGGVGEMVVRSPGNMTGYWDDPAATAATIRNGWVHTGDLASLGPDGYFRFQGRKKEIIVRGGSNVSPQEVEAVLYQHDCVQDAGVIGAPDPTWGERIVAFISRRPGRTVSAGELTAFVANRLAAYKTPAEVLFLDNLPKSATGKVQRRALRESYCAGAVGAVDCVAGF